MKQTHTNLIWTFIESLIKVKKLKSLGRITTWALLITGLISVKPANAQVVFNESFDGTTFVPAGWSIVTPAVGAVWARTTAGTHPAQSPHTGVGEAFFNSWTSGSGTQAMITPAFNLTNNTGGAAVSFWMYRDAGFVGTNDRVDVYYNTAANLTGATLLGTVNRPMGSAPVVGVAGWYQYSYTIPNTVTSSNVYLILSATSFYGNDIYVDDVSWTAYPPLCSGTPATPVVAISPSAACTGGGAFVATASGASTNFGNTYQWQSATSLGGPWGAITNATNTSYGTTTNSTTYYRMITSCSFSGLSSTTTPVSFFVGNLGACLCTSYLASNATSTFDEDIWNVTFGTLNNTSNCATVGPGPGSLLNRYANYAGFVNAPDVCKGKPIPFGVNVNTCGGWYPPMQLHIYIDYNQNGSFADAGELAYSNAAVIQGVTSGNITIPFTAAAGITRMRVVAVEFSTPSHSGTYSYGETEDYCINILPSPVISVSANSGAICPGGSFTVSASGATTFSYVSPSATLTGASVTLSPIANTIYTVNGTDGLGCVSSSISPQTVTVTNLVSPTLVPVSTTLDICPGFQATLSVSGANTYTWNGVTVASSMVVSPPATAVYTVVGTGTNVCNGVKTITITVRPTPTISVNSGTICAGKIFTMNPSGAATFTYNPSNSNTVSPAAGITTNSITGTSSFGCISTTFAVSTLTVYALPVVSATSGSICSGGAFPITMSGAAGGYTLTGGTNPVTPTVNTTYTVVGKDLLGCVSLPVLPTVTVFALPVISIAATPSNAICNTETVTLAASGANTYTWNNTDPVVSITKTPTVNSTYFVVGTDANGCSNFTSIQVTVNPLPSFNVVSSSALICPGNSATLTASSAPNYTWSTAGSPNTNSVVVTPNVTTMYGVSSTNTFGCVKTNTLTVYVNTLTIAVSSNTEICVGGNVALSASGAVTYSWSSGSTFPTAFVSPVVTSTYVVDAVDINSCKHQASVTVTVNPNPTITAIVTPTAICAGEKAVLTATGAATYTWSNPSNAGSANSVTVNPGASGTINYMLSGTSSKGCSSNGTALLVVNKCVGLSEIAGYISGLSLYPNPNNGEFTIELTNGLNKSIVVTDLAGRVILTSESVSDKTSISLNEFAQGVYYVKIKSGNNSEVVKVIKQ